MRIWGAEGYASLDFAARKATLIRPSEQLKRGRLDLEGIDLSQPAAVNEHLFGKVLRVDHVACQTSPSPSRWSSTTSSKPRGRVSRPGSAAKTRLRPSAWPTRSSGAWKPIAGTPSLPAPRPSAESASVLRGPHAWRLKSLRQDATDLSGWPGTDKVQSDRSWTA